MGMEIERKFLVDRAKWHPVQKGIHFVQGYLSSNPERTVRVRIEGDQACLTVKGPNRGISRAEFEYAIPVPDALQMLQTLCERPLIDKHRTSVTVGGHVWEVDEFHAENEGLIVAEIELESAGEAFEKPDWALQEVSGDPRYYNSSLIRNPYSGWKR